MKSVILTFTMFNAIVSGRKSQMTYLRPPRAVVGDSVMVPRPCRADLTPNESEVVRCPNRIVNTRARCLQCSTDERAIFRGAKAGRFMPDQVSQLTLRITEIREQRLGDVTEADAAREGFGSRDAFLAYFGTLHKGPIDLTLPVWAISFEVVT